MNPRKIISTLSRIVLIATALSAVTWAAKHRANDRDFGTAINATLDAFSAFPDLFTQAIEETATLPPTFVSTPKDFIPVNNLDAIGLDINALVTYSSGRSQREIGLINLRNGDTLKHWSVRGQFSQNARIMHPLLLPGDRIVYSMNGLPHIQCIDSTGTEVWKNVEFEHHHSLNLDHLGRIWASTYDRQIGPDGKPKFLKYDLQFNVNGMPFHCIDNEFTCFDPATGEAVYSKSVAQMFADHGLDHLVMRSDKTDDPYHLNDVEPALFTGAFFEAGDLFLSFRHLSLIVQFRPATDQIIRVITGPFYAQHDVDILDEHTLAIFNNNSHIHWQHKKSGQPLIPDSARHHIGNFNSGIALHHLQTGEFSTVLPHIFKGQHIFTHTEGLFEQLPGGAWFVEEQNDGILWVIDSTGVQFQGVLPSQHPGHHHLSNWTRIIS